MGSAFFPSLVYRASLPESCRDESAAPPPVVCFWAHHSLALSTLSPSFLLLNHSCSLRPPLSSSAHGFLMKEDYLAKRVRLCCSSFTYRNYFLSSSCPPLWPFGVRYSPSLLLAFHNFALVSVPLSGSGGVAPSQYRLNLVVGPRYRPVTKTDRLQRLRGLTWRVLLSRPRQ